MEVAVVRAAVASLLSSRFKSEPASPNVLLVATHNIMDGLHLDELLPRYAAIGAARDAPASADDRALGPLREHARGGIGILCVQVGARARGRRATRDASHVLIRTSRARARRTQENAPLASSAAGAEDCADVLGAAIIGRPHARKATCAHAPRLATLCVRARRRTNVSPHRSALA